jgi:hypothetical protein
MLSFTPILLVLSTNVRIVMADTVTATIYADNYFEFYVNGTLVKSDPLDFTPHNAVKFTFTSNAGYPNTYAVKAKDFATSSGYEYTSTTTPKLGDGGVRIYLSDGTVSSASWKCFTTSYGPTAASVNAGCSASNLTPCAIQNTTVASDWTSVGFDDSAWPYATTYTVAAVGWGRTPSYSNGVCSTLTDPYTGSNKSPSYQTTTADECLDPSTQSWGSSSFIWGSDLNLVNTVLCRFTSTGAASSGVTTPTNGASKLTWTLLSLVVLLVV